MKCEEKVTLCYMGPLTTAAILLQKYPAVKERIKAVVFMGGHIREGTYTPLSSVNIYYDPHAAKTVITSGIDFYMCAGDMTSNFCYVTPVSYTHLDVYKRQVYGVGAWRMGEIKGTPAMDAAYQMGKAL